MRAHFLTLPIALTVFGLAACSPKEEEPAMRTYLMGERVLMGHLIYTVFERQWMPQIGSGLDARIPQNRFYLLRISVLNSGGADAIVPTMSLVDDAGATFPKSKTARECRTSLDLCGRWRLPRQPRGTWFSMFRPSITN